MDRLLKPARVTRAEIHVKLLDMSMISYAIAKALGREEPGVHALDPKLPRFDRLSPDQPLPALKPA